MERDRHGRFAKGNKGSPGRPRAKTEEKYLRILQRSVKREDWEHIVYTAIARAKAGDARAREWLSDYLLGKPIQQVSLQTIGDLTIQLGWADAEIEGNTASSP